MGRINKITVGFVPRNGGQLPVYIRASKVGAITISCGLHRLLGSDYVEFWQDDDDRVFIFASPSHTQAFHLRTPHGSKKDTYRMFNSVSTARLIFMDHLGVLLPVYTEGVSLDIDGIRLTGFEVRLQ